MYGQGKEGLQGVSKTTFQVGFIEGGDSEKARKGTGSAYTWFKGYKLTMEGEKKPHQTEKGERGGKLVGAWAFTAGAVLKGGVGGIGGGEEG